MTKEKQTTTDAVEILHRLHIKGDPERIASLEAERLKPKSRNKSMIYANPLD